MADKVLEHIAKQHDPVREGVKTVMGGEDFELCGEGNAEKQHYLGEKRGLKEQ